tara:strand:- start:991 stop:1491 length:501 start_codon:yes stop_codon:yes gene_type:complete
MRSNKRRLKQYANPNQTEAEREQWRRNVKLGLENERYQEQIEDLKTKRDEMKKENKRLQTDLREALRELEKLRDQVKITNKRTFSGDLKNSLARTVGLRDELSEVYDEIEDKYPNFSRKTDEIPSEFKDKHRDAWNRRSKRLNNSYRYRTARALGLFQRISRKRRR